MNAARRTWQGLAAAVVVLLAGTVSEAQAQYGSSYPGYGTPAYQAYVASLRAAHRGAVAQAYAWPYQGYSYGYSGYSPNWGYHPGYNYDPYGGYLRGGADVIGAQGRYLVSIQEANLVREQVRARQLENRRWAFDHYLYERQNTPTLEQLRAEERARRSDRARSNPPVTEIYSATSLNDLLADLQQVPLAGAKDVPLNAETARRVNLTTTRDGANIGLLKHDGRLTWPAVLAGTEYKPIRDRLSALAEAAVEGVRQGKNVDRATLTQMSDDLEALQQELSAAVADADAPEHIAARRFLNQLGDALKALQQPDAANYFNGRTEFRGKTAGELVKFLTERGLWFAPATPGDELAYVVVHRALAALSTSAHTATLETGVTRR